MQRVGLYALLGIVVFAITFALWPSGQRATQQTGAKLQGVELQLYPARDLNAVWKFKAGDVINDPLTGETRLAKISDGKRILTEKTAQGTRKVIDALLSASDLVIDNGDNMTTQEARITLIKECADIDLKGTTQTPVKIEQGYGFSAPVADILSPALNGHIERLRMSFDFNIEDSDDKTSHIQYDPSSTETCVNGKKVSTSTPVKAKASKS